VILLKFWTNYIKGDSNRGPPNNWKRLTIIRSDKLFFNHITNIIIFINTITIIIVVIINTIIIIIIIIVIINNNII